MGRGENRRNAAKKTGLVTTLRYFFGNRVRRLAPAFATIQVLSKL